MPPTIRPIAAASASQLEVLQSAGPENAWTYLAPAADFAPAVELAPGDGRAPIAFMSAVPGPFRTS
ncbi:hypothetical protein ACTXKL_06640 [Brachybacterium tyrofermentans]|uniref:hypothetical protein n=1 Tax=Brachybacterium tyrofermentans TaxID=47848 RepID=UPI003FD1097D